MTTDILKNTIAVDVSPDEMEAFVTVEPSAAPGQPDRDEVTALLKDAGVTHGVTGASLDRVCAPRSVVERVLVAVGVRPIDGRPGWAEFLVGARDPDPGNGENGKVDFHDLQLIHNALKDQKIAIAHPPQPGTPGVTVRGKEIRPKDGVRAVLRPGPNTAWAGQPQTELLATVDGHVAIRPDGSVEVKPSMTITGNVDFSTGNIDFVGSLIVRGDVIGNFTVKVKKDLEIFGNVEDAVIEVGGDVTIKKGFLGHGTGKIVAGGNVKLSHILNETVESAKDVLLEKEAVNGTIRAGGKIIAPRAVIAGGRLEAVHEIEVNTLGSADGSGAKVQVGRRGRILERLNVLEKELKSAEKQVGEVKDTIYRLVKMQIDGVVLGPERELTLTKLQAAQKCLPPKIASLQEEKAQLHLELQKNSDARIVVHGIVHDNVMIEVNGVRKLIDIEIQDVIFTERAGAIEIRSP